MCGGEKRLYSGLNSSLRVAFVESRLKQLYQCTVRELVLQSTGGKLSLNTPFSSREKLDISGSQLLESVHLEAVLLLAEVG